MDEQEMIDGFALLVSERGRLFRVRAYSGAFVCYVGFRILPSELQRMCFSVYDDHDG